MGLQFRLGVCNPCIGTAADRSYVNFRVARNLETGRGDRSVNAYDKAGLRN